MNNFSGIHLIKGSDGIWARSIGVRVGKREQEYLLNLSRGKTAVDTAKIMKVSLKTVYSYRVRLLFKLQISGGELSLLAYDLFRRNGVAESISSVRAETPCREG